MRRKRVGLYIAGTSFPNPLSVYNHHLDSWSLAREGPAAGSNIATGRTVTASVPVCFGSTWAEASTSPSCKGALS